MFKKALAVFVVASLAACSDSPSENIETSAVKQAAAAQHLQKNAVYLPDSKSLEIPGWLRSYDLLSNEKGEFDRYVFESSQEIMAVEGTVYASLAKLGYTRKIRKEQPGLFVVNYVKKGAIPVTFSYETLKPDAAIKAKTRFRVSWKNA